VTSKYYINLAHKNEQQEWSYDHYCLEWTTKPPEVAGLYRVKNIRGEIFWMEILSEKGIISFEGMEGEIKPLPKNWYTHWFGPVPTPEEPK